jgi:hypothetical protein
MQLTNVLTEKDKSLIHKLYTKSPIHTRSMAEMATLERVRGTTDINRFRIRMVKLGFQCTLVSVAEVFKDLEKAGFGKLLVGSYKTSQPFRFKWAKSSIVEVGKEATKNEAPKAILPRSDSHSGKMLCMHQSPSGERLRLVFNSPHEVQELIHTLEEMIRT